MNPERERWERKWAHKDHFSPIPLPYVRDHAHLLTGGTVLDIACGYGRNALYLAELGFRVTAIDFSETALRVLRKRADKQGLCLEILNQDVEEPGRIEALGRFDNVLVVRYKPSVALFRSLARQLAAGGILLLFSFRNRRSTYGDEIVQDWKLLGNEEYLRVCDDLEVVEHETVTFDGDDCDGYVFRKRPEVKGEE